MMKNNIFKRIAVLTISLSAVICAYADDDADDDELIKSLKEELSQELKDKKQFDQTLSELEDSIAYYQKENSREMGRVEQLRIKRDQLKDDIDNALRNSDLENVDDLRKQVRQLNKQLKDINAVNSSEVYKLNEEDQTEIAALKAHNQHLRDKIDQMRQRLEELQPYGQDFVKKKAANFDNTWGKRLFSETSLAEIDKELASYNSVPTSPDMTKAIAKLKKYRDDFLIYNRGVEVINSPYVRADVTSASKAMNDLKETWASNSAQINVIEAVHNPVSAYRRSVRKLQRLLDEFAKSDSQDTEAVEALFASADLNEIVSEGIPWLNEQIEAINDELLNNPTEVGETQSLLLSLKPD